MKIWKRFFIFVQRNPFMVRKWKNVWFFRSENCFGRNSKSQLCLWAWYEPKNLFKPDGLIAQVYEIKNGRHGKGGYNGFFDFSALCAHFRTWVVSKSLFSLSRPTIWAIVWVSTTKFFFSCKKIQIWGNNEIMTFVRKLIFLILQSVDSKRTVYTNSATRNSFLPSDLLQDLQVSC